MTLKLAPFLQLESIKSFRSRSISVVTIHKIWRQIKKSPRSKVAYPNIFSLFRHCIMHRFFRFNVSRHRELVVLARHLNLIGKDKNTRMVSEDFAEIEFE